MELPYWLESSSDDIIRECDKQDFFSALNAVDSGYMDSFAEEVLTDKTEYDDDSDRVKQYPVGPFEFSISEFNSSFESSPNRTDEERDIEDLGASLKFEDPEFDSSFSKDKYDEKYADFNLSKIELPRKILVLGDAGIGKTSYVQRYISRRFESKYLWTVGVDFALKVVKWSDNISIKLQLWDIAGQERFASMTRVYYKDAHACIVMFDLTHRQSFLNALKWKRDLDSKCTLPDGSPVPCILLANKCDLEHREVNQAEIEKLCKDQEFIGWTEVSVKDGLMIDESMQFLLDDMMNRYGDLEDSVGSYYAEQDNKVVRLNENKSKQSKTKPPCIC